MKSGRKKETNLSSFKLLELEYIYPEIITGFKNNFKCKLESLISEYALNFERAEIKSIKEIMVNDATISFFNSINGKDLIKFINNTQDIKNKKIIEATIEIFSEVWIDDYLLPIKATLLFTIKDRKELRKELTGLGIELEKKKAGRESKYNFRVIFLLQIELEKKFGKRKRGHSDDTSAVKEYCKKLRIPFRHSITTAYNNWKVKYKPTEENLFNIPY